jgi:hypothetical protein
MIRCPWCGAQNYAIDNCCSTFDVIERIDGQTRGWVGRAA